MPAYIKPHRSKWLKFPFGVSTKPIWCVPNTEKHWVYFVIDKSIPFEHAVSLTFYV